MNARVQKYRELSKCREGTMELSLDCTFLPCFITEKHASEKIVDLWDWFLYITLR